MFFVSFFKPLLISLISGLMIGDSALLQEEKVSELPQLPDDIILAIVQQMRPNDYSYRSIQEYFGHYTTLRAVCKQWYALLSDSRVRPWLVDDLYRMVQQQNKRDSNGITPLGGAIGMLDDVMVAKMLAYGADPNRKTVDMALFPAVYECIKKCDRQRPLDLTILCVWPSDGSQKEQRTKICSLLTDHGGLAEKNEQWETDINPFVLLWIMEDR